MPNPAPDLTKLSDAEILDHLKEAKEDKKSADLAVKKINNELINRKSADLQTLLKAKKEPYGTVNLIVDGEKVKFDFKKKVDWDQPILATTVKQIIADGGVVEDYVETEYTVPESKWKAWGDNVRAFFKDARTVKVQSITITLEDEKEEE